MLPPWVAMLMGLHRAFGFPGLAGGRNPVLMIVDKGFCLFITLSIPLVRCMLFDPPQFIKRRHRGGDDGDAGQASVYGCALRGHAGVRGCAVRPPCHSRAGDGCGARRDREDVDGTWRPGSGHL